MLEVLAELISTGCGLGKIRPAPGTWGAAAGFALRRLFSRPGFRIPAGIFLAAVGTIVADRTSRRLRERDPSQVVIDEVVGGFIAAGGGTFGEELLRFLIFRALDVFKPLPIRRSENLPGGVGIMADDLAAGAATAALASLLEKARRKV